MNDNPHKLSVITNWNTDGIISQHMEGMLTDMTRMIIKTRDAGVRKALIDMGWTPPTDNTLEKITKEIDDEDGQSP